MRLRFRKPREGDTRIVKAFLFFPMTLNEEIRWWEWVYIRQRYEVDWEERRWKCKAWATDVEIRRYEEFKILER